jgi:hypothetical protein
MESQTRGHHAKKYDLPVQEIKRILDEGLRQIDVASLFGVSQATISRIAKTKPPATLTSKCKTELCTCCGLRPIATGNRFLCSYCYHSSDHEDHMIWA